MTDLTDQLDAAEGRYDISQAVLSHGSSSTISQLYRLGESANDVPFLLVLARKQQAAIDAVKALHKPEKRWMPYEGAGVSFDTEREAIEAMDDVDLGVVALESIAENGTPFFEVCAECKHIEDSPCEGECTLEAGYRECIWPCRTIAALEAKP